MAYPHFRKFNVYPSPPDHRDSKYRISNVSLRNEVDLREWDSPVEDQGTLGSCVSHALTSCFELMIKKELPEKFVELSRLFSYYHTRVLENSVDIDAGVTYLRNALKASSKYGICMEELWPYNIEKFKQQPAPVCYLDGFNRKVTQYKSIDTQYEALEILAQHKPVIVGMSVFESFMTINNKNPIVPMPEEYDYIVGGHAVAIVGYSLPKQQFIIKNSFGAEWGENGYAYMPFEYFNKYVFERWMFNVTTEDNTVVTEN